MVLSKRGRSRGEKVMEMVRMVVARRWGGVLEKGEGLRGGAQNDRCRSLTDAAG